MEEH